MSNVSETDKKYARMASGRDEVEQSVDAVVAEARVTLDAGLFCEDVVVFALEVAENFLEASEPGPRASERSPTVVSDARKLVINVVSKARGVDNGERDADAVLLELCESVCA